MYLQISIWGTRELVKELEFCYERNTWIHYQGKDLNDLLKRSFLRNKSCSSEPCIQSSNSSIGQVGSVFPKLLYFYNDLPSEFQFSYERKSFVAKMQPIHDYLSPYYNNVIGCRSRAKDSDNFSVYPDTSHESDCYFTTHNIFSEYAGEDILRLISEQMQRLRKSHCFMYVINAVDFSFNKCYQLIRIPNRQQIISTFYKDNKENHCPEECEKSWLAEIEYGYGVDNLEQYIDLENIKEVLDSKIDEDEIAGYVSSTDIKAFIDSKYISADDLSTLELERFVKWDSRLENWRNHGFIGDLAMTFKQFNVAPESNINELQFSWEW